MKTSMLLTAMALLATTLFAKSADAAQACVFYADDSVYYNTASESSDVYAYGPISFVWEPATSRILGGYYTEQVVYHAPVLTYFNNITAGSIFGSVDPYLNLLIPFMAFSRAVPDSYSTSMQSGSLTGTTSSATFDGYLDGPYLITATGTVTCN